MIAPRDLVNPTTHSQDIHRGDPAIAILAGIALIVVTAIAVVVVYLPRRKSAAPVASAADVAADPGPQSVPFATDATEAVFGDCHRLAFAVSRFDYQIIADHASVLESVNAAAAESVHHREYFPRRPMLLPKLLQTLNDTESTRQELVELILEDPSLAGNVLERANSAWYRVTPQPIDSLDRAVVALGTEGLRGLMAVAILQPVFRLPKGYFDGFAPITWEQAQRCAVAAEAYAKSTHSCDPFVAQLLGLLGALARIVLFRLTMDMYRDWPKLLPRAEVFIRGMQAQGPRVAGLLASTWELSDPSVTALDEQALRLSPGAMTPLGRAVYYGELAGALAMLERREAWSADGAHALLTEQGLPRDIAHAVRHAALSVGRATGTSSP